MVTNAAPLTCYSRMLGMRKEINSSIENLQAKQFTVSTPSHICYWGWNRGTYSCQLTRFYILFSNTFKKRCVAKLPDLHIDIHNFCVMSKLRTYLQAMEKVTDRRCQNVLQPTVQLIRHLYLIMVVPCKAELVFLTDDCSVLRRKASTTT
ncbi:cytokine-like protein 1 isoform X1 [Rhincodon typus]|uniref:cytokine-like protein 1 isoform X1 n=1 Tax=Rhincodon typus TaxID=259920 RepID=UPI00202E4D97|nr:cytokine-like protein 1 isoform X1 [Rhincodon typus]